MRTRICVCVVAFCLVAFFNCLTWVPGAAVLFALGAIGWGWMLGHEIQREHPGVMEWLTARIVARAQRTPYRHLDGYMRRWWLLRLGRSRTTSAGDVYPRFAARVHHILTSDVGAFHDHPWPFITLILHGGYFELRPKLDRRGQVVRTRTRWHGPGSILIRRAKAWHLLQLAPGQTAWTLFCMGPPTQDWGFLVAGQKIPHRDYLGAHPVRPPAAPAA